MQARKLILLVAMFLVAVSLWFVGPTVTADPGDTTTTLAVPMELPVEVEIELSPAGSLKQAPLWKELVQLLKKPYAAVVRRPGFGVAMPSLNTYPLDYNFLTGQPLRLRTSDGETSWDQPGPVFYPDEVVATDAFNTPTQLRTVIGHLVACPDNGAYEAAAVPATFCDGKSNGSLVVYNPNANTDIPPNGTVVAVAAFFDGRLHELVFDANGVWTGAYEEIVELETPVNEEDFFRDPADVQGVGTPLRPYIGRLGAEILGKALFWDMQVGSDSVQACASCHFHAGADNRTRNQLNPNHLSGDTSLQVAGPNQAVVASDFPFHKLANPDEVGEPLKNPTNVLSDANDVMSSMGVSQFKQFVDIPTPGNTAFGPPSAVGGVRPLLPDIGTVVADPIPVFQAEVIGDSIGDDDGICEPGEACVPLRRVEPRNTPTFHGAAFNFDNFWDGRARFVFNGGSVFGASDPQAHIFIDPANPGPNGGGLQGATNGHIRPDLITEGDPTAGQPVRIKFSSLASQAVGPPLSDFEMSFAGRNWAKIGKKMLQNGVTPLANQLVAIDDSRLGSFSNQGGAACLALGRPTAAKKPGLCTTYQELIELAFESHLWHSNGQHLNGAPGADPFDGYVLTVANGAAQPSNTNQFTQKEANFSLFFGLSVQAYEELTIPDNTPADRFFDANPNAGHAVGEPGDQAVLFPTLIRDLLDDGDLNGTFGGSVTLIPDDPSTPEYDGFGPDELFGFDLFSGANLTAGLAASQATDPISGRNRNPQITNSLAQTIRVGSNPFTRSAKCMLCHLGPEQTDHSINIAHGLLKNDAEFEYPTPPRVPDPTTPATFADGFLPAPEPSGSSKIVPGLILAEEVGEGVAQDAVEVEPRNFATFDDPTTPWDDRIIAQPGNFAFGDQGIYNIGVRPTAEDIGRGGNDPFGWPLSLAALTLKNIGGQGFEPNDSQFENNVMANFDPSNIDATFEETGDGAFFPGTTYTLQSINPGFERDPINPQMPAYMVPWIHSLPAGELHPQIDEMAGMVPNTITPPNGGPGIEFPEILFGADLHCATYNPAVFGSGPPNFGWGATDPVTALPVLGKCPQTQSGVAGNHAFPSQGTWPVPNRVLRDGAFKAPPLRNIEMTGPYFHTGSYLTLRQVVDFYFRGGDFPVSNAANRDPHLVDLDLQAFAFGTTNVIGDPNYTNVNSGILQGSFGDGLPDTSFLYDAYPDSDHSITPEPVFASRAAALEDAKNALVKFLLALTDPRVKHERAPFDHPQLFVPIDGAAPENTGGPAQLISLSGVSCPVTSVPGTGICFRQIPSVGAGGNATALPNFLGISSTVVPGPSNDHFDR